jgi:hypothetical protein
MSEDVSDSGLRKLLTEFINLSSSSSLKELFAFAEDSGVDEFKQLAELMKISESRKQLLQSWMVGYEKAIMGRHFHQAKLVTDEACYEAVEDFTQRMRKNDWIDAIHGKEYNTLEDAIKHHVANLMKADIWKPGHEPHITQADSEGLELIIDVPECQFLEGCRWAKESEYFNPVHKFRCQRVGCFIGAIKKYLKEDQLPSGFKSDYFMTKIHEDSGCSAVVFAGRGFARRQLLTKYGVSQKENPE